MIVVWKPFLGLFDETIEQNRFADAAQSGRDQALRRPAALEAPEHDVDRLEENINLDDLFAVAKESSIKRSRAARMIDDVRAAIADFPSFAATYGVGKAALASFKRLTAGFDARTN